MKKCKKNYNPKIDYLICKYFSSEKIEITSEITWKDIYNSKTLPENANQQMMINCKKALEFIKKDSVGFNMKNIKKCYQLISSENLKLNDNQRRQIEDIVNGFNEERSYDYAGLVFLKVLQNKVFDKFNIEMAKLLHNFVQIKCNYIPTIFYYSQTNKIIELIKENEVEGALFIIKNAYQKTEHFNIKHRLIHFDELNVIIQKLKPKLIEDFGVVELSVYGSFSRGEENEYSDLDLYIVVNNSGMQPIDNKYRIALLLEKELGIYADVKLCDKGHETDLKPDMIRDLKLLFSILKEEKKYEN